MPTGSSTLNRTPLHAFHVEHRARLVEFAGWEMPILYRSIRQEHLQVRRSAGVFDVSHMGRLRFTGPEARRFLDTVCSRQIFGMADGQCRYTLVTNECGGCRDDGLVYRLAGDDYLLVCNAANRLKLIEHFRKVGGVLDLQMRDETPETAMVALQGPQVLDRLAAVIPVVTGLKRFRFAQCEIPSEKPTMRLLVSRTGYTGEDGVEVVVPAADALEAVELLRGGGAPPIEPAGLGARDTLRTEAAMPLYGHEISEEIDPLSAGLAFAVQLDKGEDDDDVPSFVGQEALRRIARTGPARRLAGLILEGRRTARPGMKVTAGGSEVGFVTSACLSPTLERPIAMAYLEASRGTVGGRVEVDLGRTPVGAAVTALPFHKRGSP